MYPFGHKWWNKAIPYIGMLPAILFYLVFYFGPSMATMVLSLTDISGVPGYPWNWVGFKNYREFFRPGTSRDKIMALRNTILFSVTVTLLQNTLALVLAVILNKKRKGYIFCRALVFLPVVLGVTVAGLMWKLILNPLGGPVQQLLGFLGTRSNLLGSMKMAFPLVIAIQIWIFLGYSMVIYLAGLQTIPQELYEAGHVDGVGDFQAFRLITLPLIAPAITVNVLLAIIGSMQVFDTIFVVTGGQFNTRTLAYQMYIEAFGPSSRQGYAAAISVLLFGLIFVVTLVFQYYLRRREFQA